MFALSYGVSQFVQNLSFGALFYASARFSYHYPTNPKMNGEVLWLALFSMMFGTFGSAQATAFGPDVKKAQTAAEKIFTITDTPSEIDVLAEEE